MSDYKPCPKCAATNAAKVGFTWWGGALGPSLLTHVKCPSCGTTYNGKTGQPNTAGIVIYSVVTGILAFVIVAMLTRR